MGNPAWTPVDETASQWKPVEESAPKPESMGSRFAGGIQDAFIKPLEGLTKSFMEWNQIRKDAMARGYITPEQQARLKQMGPSLTDVVLGSGVAVVKGLASGPIDKLKQGNIAGALGEGMTNAATVWSGLPEQKATGPLPSVWEGAVPETIPAGAAGTRNIANVLPILKREAISALQRKIPLYERIAGKSTPKPTFTDYIDALKKQAPEGESGVVNAYPSEARGPFKPYEGDLTVPESQTPVSPTVAESPLKAKNAIALGNPEPVPNMEGIYDYPLLKNGERIGHARISISEGEARVGWFGPDNRAGGAPIEVGGRNALALKTQFEQANPGIKLKWNPGTATNERAAARAARRVEDNPTWTQPQSMEGYYGKYSGQSNLSKNQRQLGSRQSAPDVAVEAQVPTSSEHMTQLLQQSIELNRLLKASGLQIEPGTGRIIRAQ